MKKLFTLFTILVSISVSAQTLFYYGNDSVSQKEFLKTYYKNNTGLRNQKVFTDYLDLYINSRLKIKEAKEKGYDTLTQIQTELENLRQQILPSYLNDKASMEKLQEEAFLRSQKDIHLAHIFISYTRSSKYDTATAFNKLTAVLEKLMENKNFGEVAHTYSDDPAAAVNNGDLGYITVFSLPYELENLAYSLKVGEVSSVYRSTAGYHIFKNLGERRDPGKIKAAQILFAFPPGLEDEAKANIKRTADSVYNRLIKGADFAAAAAKYSNDNISASANGQMPDISVGQFDEVFTKAVYALPADGSISKPFLDADGYHIVKRLGKSEAFTKSDPRSVALLKARVESSDRMKMPRSLLAHRLMNDAGYKQYPFNNADLWAFTDSALNYIKPASYIPLKNNSPLFTLGNKTLTTTDWLGYAQTFRYKSDGSGTKPYPQIWNEFLEATAIDYYQKHLEEFNEEFRQQLNEFREGNLFFEIMQRKVWGPAQTDSAALLDYYGKNKSKYNWKESADAILFYANDLATAKIFSDQLKKNPSLWHNLVSSFSEKIAADSSRFEVKQIPNALKQPLKAGQITSPVINKADNTVSFAYIVRIHPKPEPRNYADSRGLVVNDYQNMVEQEWIASLKIKYPVHVNENVWKEMIKEKKF